MTSREKKSQHREEWTKMTDDNKSFLTYYITDQLYTQKSETKFKLSSFSEPLVIELV